MRYFTLFTFTLQYWMSINYTYEGITMCLYKLQVHCTFDVTKVEHSCVIDEVLHVVHFHSTVLDVYYLHL